MYPLIVSFAVWLVSFVGFGAFNSFSNIWFPALFASVSALPFAVWSIAAHRVYKDIAVDDVIEAYPLPFIVKDADGKFVMCNKAFEDLVGKEKKEIIGQKASELLPVDYGDEGEQGGGVMEFLVPSDGDDRHLLIYKSHFGRQGWRWVVAGVVDVTEHRKAEQVFRQKAYRDKLTNLPNREMFEEILNETVDRAYKSCEPMALMFIDLDRFKWVNDTLGHDAGDDLLVQVAARLSQVVRKSDRLCRLAGDEFTVILTSLANTSDVQVVAKKIIAALGEPFTVAGNQISIGGSVGIAVYPESGTTPEELLKHADAAMYKAKGEGRNRFRLFTSEMNDEMVKRAVMERDLRHAVENGELSLVYQPIIRLIDGSIAGFETFVRWPRRDGLLTPDKFLHYAESGNFIDTLTEFVVRKASLEMSRLLNEIPESYVAVNISPSQMKGGTLISVLKRMPEIAPKTVIEIAETDVLGDNAKMIRSIQELGYRVALDDFGTGSTSLTTLRNASVDFLKIHGSLMSDTEDKGQMAGAVLAMASSVGAKVVAEGIETSDQREILKKIGCEYAQGYLFSRPMPAAALYDHVNLVKNSKA